MTTVTVSEARKQIGDIVNRVQYGDERVCLTKNGKEAACLVSMEEARLLDVFERYVDMADALEALEEMDREGTTSWEMVKAELGL